MNQERGLILSNIDSALADYGTRHGSLRAKFTSANTCQMLKFNAAKPRDILSLQNWVNGSACLAREETAYLTRGDDLFCSASPNESCIKATENWLEDNIIHFYKGFRKVSTLIVLGPSFNLS
jgi:hypothetical protein